MPALHTCKDCGRHFYRFSTAQTRCGFCQSKKRVQVPRTAIKQRGKHAERWTTFRDKIAIPYLDKKYGHVCSVAGCGETRRLDVDHIKPRGSHPELRYDVKNLRYLCRPHHVQRTGAVRWSRKDAV